MRSIPYLLPQPVSWAHSYWHSAGEIWSGHWSWGTPPHSPAWPVRTTRGWSLVRSPSARPPCLPSSEPRAAGRPELSCYSSGPHRGRCEWSLRRWGTVCAAASPPASQTCPGRWQPSLAAGTSPLSAHRWTLWTGISGRPRSRGRGVSGWSARKESRQQPPVPRRAALGAGKGRPRHASPRSRAAGHTAGQEAKAGTGWGSSRPLLLLSATPGPTALRSKGDRARTAPAPARHSPRPPQPRRTCGTARRERGGSALARLSPDTFSPWAPGLTDSAGLLLLPARRRRPLPEPVA